MTRILLTMAILVCCGLTAFAQETGANSLPTEVTKVSFTRGDFIYLLDRDSKAPVRLVKGTDPGLSSSGRLLAYTINTAGSQNADRTIRVMNLQTRVISDFKSLAGYISYMPIWSQDESQFAFSIFIDSDWRVAVMDVTSGKWTSVTNLLPGKAGSYLSSWAPGGKSIICHDLNSIYEVDLDGKVKNTWSVEKIAGDNGVSSATRFTLSDDRRYMIFDTSEAEESATVFLFDLQNNKLQRLTGMNVSAGQPILLPGSEEFLYSTFRKMPRNNGVFDVYKSSITPGRPVLVLRNAWNLSIATK